MASGAGLQQESLFEGTGDGTTIQGNNVVCLNYNITFASLGKLSKLLEFEVSTQISEHGRLAKITAATGIWNISQSLCVGGLVPSYQGHSAVTRSKLTSVRVAHCYVHSWTSWYEAGPSWRGDHWSKVWEVYPDLRTALPFLFLCLSFFFITTMLSTHHS